jgi:hypothetical protein
MKWWFVVGVVACAVVVGAIAAGPSADRAVSVSIASGDSMGHDYPEVIVIENKPISRGDEILFQNRGGEWVHHRVVGTFEGSWQTQGDANDHPDQYRDTAPKSDAIVGMPLPTEANTAGVVVWSVTVDVLASWVASLVLGVLGVPVLEADVPAAVRDVDRAFM